MEGSQHIKGSPNRLPPFRFLDATDCFPQAVVSGGDDGAIKTWPLAFHLSLSAARMQAEEAKGSPDVVKALPGFQGHRVPFPAPILPEGQKPRRVQIVYLETLKDGRFILTVSSTVRGVSSSNPWLCSFITILLKRQGDVWLYSVFERSWALATNIFDSLPAQCTPQIVTCASIAYDDHLLVGLLNGITAIFKIMEDGESFSLHLRCYWQCYSGRTLGCWWNSISSFVHHDLCWDDYSVFTAGERGEITWWALSIPQSGDKAATISRLATYVTPNFSPPSSLAFSETMNVLAIGNVIGAIFLFDASAGQTAYRMWRRGETSRLGEEDGGGFGRLLPDLNAATLPSAWLRSIHGRNRVSTLAFHEDKLWVGGPTGTISVLKVTSQFPFSTIEESDRALEAEPSSWTLLWVQPLSGNEDYGPVLCRRRYLEVDLCFDGGYLWPHAQGFVNVEVPVAQKNGKGQETTIEGSQEPVRMKRKWVVWKGDHPSAKQWGLTTRQYRRVCLIDAARIAVYRVAPIQMTLGWRFFNASGAGSPFTTTGTRFGYEDTMAIAGELETTADGLHQPLLVLGVRENNLMLYSTGNATPTDAAQTSGKVVYLECKIGGWRKRPYAVYVSDKGPEARTVVAWQVPGNKGPPALAILSLDSPSETLSHRTLPSDFHGKILRGIALLPSPSGVVATRAVTVSEDNAIRLVEIAGSTVPNSDCAPPIPPDSPSKRARISRMLKDEQSIRCFQTMEAHVAGIRCVAATRLLSEYFGLFSCIAPDELARVSCPVLVVTAGSRDQLMVWEVADDEERNQAPSLQWLCSAVYTQSSAEQRIHSLAVLPLPIIENLQGDESGEIRKFLVLSGNSEGLLCLYLLDTYYRSCIEVLRCKGTQKPVLSLDFVAFPAAVTQLSPQDEGEVFDASPVVRVLVVQGSSDGSVSLWDFTPVVQQLTTLCSHKPWPAIMNSACRPTQDNDLQGDVIPSVSAGAKGEYTPWRDKEKKSDGDDEAREAVDQGLPTSKKKVPRTIATPTPSIQAAIDNLEDLPPWKGAPVFLTRWSPHQAGVNTCSGVVEWDLEADLGTLTVVAGGDDQAFSVSRVLLRGSSDGQSAGRQVRAASVEATVFKECSSSALTGLKLLPSTDGWLAVVAGVDQRLQVWEVSRFGVRSKEAGNAEFVIAINEVPFGESQDPSVTNLVGTKFQGETIVEIPDIGDVDARYISPDTIEVVVAGHGMQYILVSLRER